MTFQNVFILYWCWAFTTVHSCIIQLHIFNIFISSQKTLTRVLKKKSRCTIFFVFRNSEVNREKGIKACSGGVNNWYANYRHGNTITAGSVKAVTNGPLIWSHSISPFFAVFPLSVPCFLLSLLQSHSSLHFAVLPAVTHLCLLSLFFTLP